MPFQALQSFRAKLLHTLRGSHLSALLKHKIDKGRSEEGEKERQLLENLAINQLGQHSKLQLIGTQSNRAGKGEKERKGTHSLECGKR